jgi:hypothetical protein
MFRVQLCFLLTLIAFGQQAPADQAVLIVNIAQMRDQGTRTRVEALNQKLLKEWFPKEGRLALQGKTILVHFRGEAFGFFRVDVWKIDAKRDQLGVLISLSYETDKLYDSTKGDEALSAIVEQIHRVATMAPGKTPAPLPPSLVAPTRQRASTADRPSRVGSAVILFFFNLLISSKTKISQKYWISSIFD